MNWMIFGLLTILLTFAGSSSCKKKSVIYTIKGKVSDNSFSKDFANLPLKVEVKYSKNLVYSDLINIITDSQGNFSFEFERELIENIRISASPNLYFPISKIVQFSSLTLDENVVNMSTWAQSWVRLVFSNPDGNSSDKLGYIKQVGKSNCADCCPNEEQLIFGPTQDTVYCINNGNTNYTMFYQQYASQNVGTKTVFTTSFDTTTLLLEY